MFTRSSQSASLKLRVHTSNEKASFRRTGIDAGGAVQQPSKHDEDNASHETIEAGSIRVRAAAASVISSGF
ncbi:hypothetical protein Q1M64_13525 (plasmid) [Sinorhizobium meliloti]|uniref:hypothetical protein n=1 Tax=Rhizobium meliloti TaxID=382 RepID=UPI000FD888EE|nr:hypothetical protein [Sinorhizobium meliloti]RVK31874.1 hypothetical protein CN161_20355 [Sinorhizobium meliloti]WKL39876.1 hypothetical protein Q1M64_13525 [Sinorhizobium meliloti]